MLSEFLGRRGHVQQAEKRLKDLRLRSSRDRVMFLSITPPMSGVNQVVPLLVLSFRFLVWLSSCSSCFQLCFSILPNKGVWNLSSHFYAPSTCQMGLPGYGRIPDIGQTEVFDTDSCFHGDLPRSLQQASSPCLALIWPTKCTTSPFLQARGPCATVLARPSGHVSNPSDWLLLSRGLRRQMPTVRLRKVSRH